MDEHKGSVNDIAFTPDGKRLVSGSLDKTLVVRDVESGGLIHRMRGHTGEILSVAVCGPRIASGGLDGIIRLWDADKGTLIHAFPMMPQVIRRLTFRPDGKRLAATCDGKPIYIWDADPARLKMPSDAALIRGNRDLVVGMAFSPSGDRLACVTRAPDSTVRIWNAGVDQECTVYNLPKKGDAMALSPTRPLVAVVGNDQQVHLWNWRTGTHQALTGHAAVVSAVAFSGDGTLASAGADGKLCIWVVDLAKKLREFAGTGKPVNALEFHPGGHRLVTGDADGVVQFWEAAGGRKLYAGPAHQGLVLDLAFSPDGKQLASAGKDGAIVLCDAETGKELRRLRDPDRTPNCLAFSADSQLLAAGDQEHTIRVWEAQTGKQTHLFEGHDAIVNGVAFSHNGRRLASAGGSGDGTVKLWDLTTGLELLTLRGHGRAVNGVVFAPDDAALLTLGQLAELSKANLRVWRSEH